MRALPAIKPIESAARYPRAAVLVLLIVTVVPGWIWIVMMAGDMNASMTGASAWMMPVAWDWPHVVLLWAMWAVMMAAMMLPAAAPILLLYANAVRKRHPPASGTASSLLGLWLLAAGYVAVWAAFSVGATALQRVLARLAVLTPMMKASSEEAGAAILLAAGLYQLTPLKNGCLRVCRSPLAFLTQRWRAGGAFRVGAEHGAYCLGCCWALMLLLFAGGVMNLTVIVALTLWVLVEKLTPFGEQSARAAGIALIVTALWMWAA